MAEQSNGPATDRSNDPVIDPSLNVKEKVEDAVKRLDDLRIQDSEHIRELLKIRAEYEEKLSRAESGRIDAIRAVDVGAVQRAAEVASTAAQALATQVAVSAETLRTQVATTATAGAVSLAAALEPIQKDVQDLRRVQYEQQGQSAQRVESKTDSRGGFNTGLVIASVVIAFFSLMVAAGLGILVVTQ